jgi:uncharacterized iron-regulated membrane protein
MVYNCTRMGFWNQWLRQPQRVWLRRAIFQLHLWTGLAIGLYVVVLSLSGSVLVYRNELDRLLASPRATFDERATPLTANQIRAAAERLYPGWTVTTVNEGRFEVRTGRGGVPRLPDPTASVLFERGSETKGPALQPVHR